MGQACTRTGTSTGNALPRTSIGKVRVWGLTYIYWRGDEGKTITTRQKNKMPTNPHRIVIWPSDHGDIPKLPVYTDTLSDEYAADQTIRPGAVVVGWVDETASDVTIIAVGLVILSNSEGVEKSKAVEQLSKALVTDAIRLLTVRNPCQYSTESDGCGVCCNCSTYRSLRVLGIADYGKTGSENKKEALGNESIQLILYNQREAETYLQDQQQQLGKRYPYGTWQRNALRMGEALSVFEMLSSAMKNMQYCKNQRNDVTPSMSNKIKGDSADVCDTETRSSFQQRQKETHHSILHQSLFLLRLKSGTCCRQKNKWTPFIFSHMPFFHVIQCLTHEITTISPNSRQLGMRERKPNRMDSQFIALVLDSIFGLFIGCTLLTYPFAIVQSIIQLWKNFHNQQWNDGLEWLESFPAGFKLNVALTQQIGREARLALQLHQNIASFLFKTDSCIIIKAATTHTDNSLTSIMPTTFVRCLGLFTVLFGSQFFFGLAFDMTQVALLHIRFLSFTFAALQRVELSTLISLWGLFCGKKRNVLRVRYDTLKYDHMQLLLGIILFTICLFMFTTILVYHCYFAIMNYSAEVFLCGCWWFGFMFVEGVARCDFVVISTRRSQNDAKDTWIGRGVQFLPVRLPHTPYVDCLLENVGAIFDDSEKAPIHKREQFNAGQKCTKYLHPHVSISSERFSAMKVTFPSNSDFSIIATVFCSFVLSKISLIVTFLQSLVFGTPIPTTSALVDFVRIQRQDHDHK
jgi:hypothetical protein